MAVPAYATDLVDITTAFSTTNWNLLSEGGGGQNALTAPETDDLIQGTECVSRNPFSSSIRGIAYDRATITVAADDAVFHWWKADVAAALNTLAAGGVHLIQGSSLTVYKKFYVAGSNTYQLGGWRCTPIDPTATPSASRGTEPSPDFNTFGVAFDIPASGPSKGFPFKADMIRHGRQVEVTEGEVANPATWSSFAAHADASARRWGILQGNDTGASLQGIAIWGTATTAVYSRDSNRAIALLDTLGFTTTDFTQIVFSNASNDIEWDNVGLIALGSSNRGIIDVTANGILKWTNSVIQNIDTTNLLSNCTFDGTTWIACNEVDSGGGSLLGATILVPTVAANSYSLLWDVNADPNGKLDGMTFSKGTTAHHAITFGLNSPTTSMTLTNCSFGTDFSGTENGTTGDETFHFLDTTGTITLNLIGCTGNFGFRTEGVAVTIVVSPVTLTVATTTALGDPLSGARVLVIPADGTGPLPYQESITITQSAGTATATHTGHGLVTGNKVLIEGSTNSEEYNGVETITVTGVNSYTYPVDSGTPSPATGTITSTAVIIEDLTAGSPPIVSNTRTYSGDQPIAGRARKTSGAPYYKTSPIVGTISATTGLSLTIQMNLDQ